MIINDNIFNIFEKHKNKIEKIHKNSSIKNKK